MALLVITSTVYVNSSLTVLTDSDIRLKQYIESILFYLKSKRIDKIIVCDNSLYDYSQNTELRNNPEFKKIEFLNFMGNSEKIQEKGKGYGEGEIMSYIFSNSVFMNDEPHDFYKITGRIFLVNIDYIIEHTNNKFDYFQSIGLNPYSNLKKVDTRFYHCTKETFQIFLESASDLVNDRIGKYLEHVYYDILSAQKINYKNFNALPKFGGISGSTGKAYTIKNPKWFFLKYIYRIIHKIHG